HGAIAAEIDGAKTAAVRSRSRVVAGANVEDRHSRAAEGRVDGDGEAASLKDDGGARAKLDDGVTGGRDSPRLDDVGARGHGQLGGVRNADLGIAPGPNHRDGTATEALRPITRECWSARQGQRSERVAGRTGSTGPGDARVTTLADTAYHQDLA